MSARAWRGRKNGQWSAQLKAAKRAAKQCAICGAGERSPAHAPAGNFNGGHNYTPAVVAGTGQETQR